MFRAKRNSYSKKRHRTFPEPNIRIRMKIKKTEGLLVLIEKPSKKIFCRLFPALKENALSNGGSEVR